ncbi:hypothetical protein M758_5G034900 [Ceratodon purpureus]|uniref:Uncharacterized protein n=1 Tax=Ceratodon purpureus TaxID=3225 RepID=A0A8T0HZW9_CERPU|nr:hypothetical protein KC19_5G035000 [Ceratodon purpureus]KAG0615358.1 hypothetical protein M758_5G034900 [Ceratodon purpureus]
MPCVRSRGSALCEEERVWRDSLSLFEFKRVVYESVAGGNHCRFCLEASLQSLIPSVAFARLSRRSDGGLNRSATSAWSSHCCVAGFDCFRRSVTAKCAQKSGSVVV